jgi:hypothetical protein
MGIDVYFMAEFVRKIPKSSVENRNIIAKGEVKA